MSVDKFGRPTKYSDEFGELICQRVATHPVGYDTLMEMYPDMPHSSTVRAWRRQYADFCTKYAEAKAFQAQILVEEIDDMIPPGVRYYIDDKGNERIDAPSASLLIAKIHNRKWTAARLASRTYGDKGNIEDKSSVSETLSKIKSMVEDFKNGDSSQ